MTYPSRTDTDIIISLILVIGEHSMIRKTHLMEKSNMNSKRLKLYLNWLELNDLVRIDGQKITLTEHGIRFRSRCLELVEA